MQLHRSSVEQAVLELAEVVNDVGFAPGIELGCDLELLRYLIWCVRLCSQGQSNFCLQILGQRPAGSQTFQLLPMLTVLRAKAQ